MLEDVDHQQQVKMLGGRSRVTGNQLDPVRDGLGCLTEPQRCRGDIETYHPWNAKVPRYLAQHPSGAAPDIADGRRPQLIAVKQRDYLESLPGAVRVVPVVISLKVFS